MSDRGPDEPIRVLHCPAMVGGHPWGLAHAERELGVHSWAVSFEPVHPGYNADEVLFERGTGRVRRELRRWRFLGRALRSFDVVHFNFGSSILPRFHPAWLAGNRGAAGRLYGAYSRLLQLRDLPLLKRAGKVIVVTYQGDDARQADGLFERIDEAYYDELRDYYSPEVDRRKRGAISTFDRYADAIYALNPDLLGVLPERAEFLPYASVDPAKWQVEDTEPTRSGPAVVVHAPTDRRAKGTRFVIDAVAHLRERGVEVELLLVEGLDHDQARAAYRHADLFVDQLVLGWYGTAAVELMALGKPVVAHLHDDDLARIPGQMRADLPVIRATATTLADVLEEWLTTRRPNLGEVGRQGRSFVQRWHDPRAVASQTKARYEEILERLSQRG